MIMADDSTVRNKNNNIPDVQTMYPYPGCTKSKVWEYFGLLKKLYLLFEINTYGSSPLSRRFALPLLLFVLMSDMDVRANGKFYVQNLPFSRALNHGDILW
jgi:hypothetical protein